MGWLQQSYKQSQYGRSSGGMFAGRDFGIRRGLHKTVRRRATLQLAAVVAAAMLAPLEAGAFEPRLAVHASGSHGSLRMMSEDELRRVFGRALPEDRLFRTARSMSSGFVVDILGDSAMLLNPLSNLLDADVTFRDASFNPLNPTVLIDSSGSYMIRFPDTIGTLSFENIRVGGSNGGPSFGSVTIRDIDLRGTTIRVTLRRD